MRLSPLFLAALMPLTAAEVPGFGVHGAWIKPVGDLRDLNDSKAGFAGGLHLSFNFNEGILLRTHLTQTVFGDGHSVRSYALAGTSYRDSTTQQVEALQIGLDLLVFGRTGTRRGPYFLMGFSQDAWRVTTQTRLETLSGPQAGMTSGSRLQTATQIGGATGLGWRFPRHWSAELRYEWSSFGRTAIGMDSLRLQAGYRF